MSLNSLMINFLFAKGDRVRDKGLVAPKEVEAYCDLRYAEGSGKFHLLDIYRPKERKGKTIPVIVSIHGGAYVYGTKEIYKFYGMEMAKKGFAFVNFNYRLAPGSKFPNQLYDTNLVLEWMVVNHEQYGLDLDNVFLVGDSAGAQLASQYAAIAANTEYAKLFTFKVPKEIGIRALGLNCGMYDISDVGMKHFGEATKIKLNDLEKLLKDYLGKKREKVQPILEMEKALTNSYPPCFIMSAYYDFLKEWAPYFHQKLKEKGIFSELHIYGEEGQTYMGHVFHVNVKLEEADLCNSDTCDFFLRYIQ